MAKNKQWQRIPTSLNEKQFNQFVLPHLETGSREPEPKLSLQVIFNYILRVLYTGCQWKELPITKDHTGQSEIHYTRVYRMFRFWEVRGCLNTIFDGVVSEVHQAGLLDTAVLHGDGTTSAAKKGGDNIGFSGHKKIGSLRLCVDGLILVQFWQHINSLKAAYNDMRKHQSIATDFC